MGYRNLVIRTYSDGFYCFILGAVDMFWFLNMDAARSQLVSHVPTNETRPTQTLLNSFVMQSGLVTVRGGL